MATDPYTVLGVAKTATADEIKKAYRKLVRTSHPDLHPDDPAAEGRFKAISAAFELLKDPDTRARYDAGEIDASGAERPGRTFYKDYAGAAGGPRSQEQGFHDFGDPADIFAEILRRRNRTGPGQRSQGFSAPGEDYRYTLNVAFLDAVRGAKTRITLPGGDTLDVQIPAGVADGQTLRLRGKGGPGYGSGLPGDALVTVILEPHPVFRREGLDIHVTLPITIDEAILGGKVMVPTIAGPVSVTIPKAVSSGRILRLRGRGISRGSAPPGDQLVELRITSPAKIDPDLQSFMEKWRTSHAYDPRKDVFGNLAEGGAQ
jgi:DnaJ-class molecular chaperone